MQAFSRLIDLNEDERSVELDKIKAQRPAVHDLVVSLLRADREGDTNAFLTNWAALDPMAGATADTDRVDSDEPLKSGVMLGPWSIEGHVGNGGMGEVYLGHRADGAFDRQVAIKLLKQGFESSGIIGRFLRERRILAQLSHRNIAQLIDAGTTVHGRPYFVMEYVEGQALDLYVRSVGLDVEQIIQLFITVCDAVQAAHDLRIVHRDLKPSNIMVTFQGQVKLLDFGIAKALLEDVGDDATLVGTTPLTPAYAAPEQIRGQTVTPASDVFSLGVVLFELLSSQRPYERQSRSLAAVLLNLENERAECPSAVLRRERGRREEAERLLLIRSIPRDLDLIVLKALSPEPARRYASAGQLSDDLRLLQAHQPIKARPDSVAYRSSRFLRRHRAVVIGTAAVVIALVFGLTFALWQASVARSQTLAAEHVKQFMLTFVREQDRYRRAGSQARSEDDQLRDAIARANTDLREEPAARVEVIQALADIAVDTGSMTLVQQTLASALEDVRRLYGSKSRQTAAMLADLANAEYFNDRVEAIRHAREAYTLMKAHGDDATLAFADLEGRLGLLEGQDAGHLARGEALLADSVRLFNLIKGPENPNTAQMRYQLLILQAEDGHDDRVEAGLRQVIGSVEKALGTESIRLQAPLRALTLLKIRQGHLAEALTIADRGVAIAQHQSHGRDQRLADAMRARLEVLTSLRRFDEATTLESDIMNAIPPDAATMLVVCRRSIARLHVAMDQWTEAAAITQQNLDGLPRGANTLGALTDRSLHALAMAHLGEIELAQAQAQAAIDLATPLWGSSRMSLPEANGFRATILQMQGRNVEATDVRRGVLEAIANSGSKSTALWATQALALANCLALSDEAKDQAEARELVRQVEVVNEALKNT